MYDAAAPTQPFKVGVTVIVAVIGALVVLVAVKASMFAFPVAAKPIAVFEFVQVKVAPVGTVVKTAAGIVAPAHTVVFVGTVTTGGVPIVMVCVEMSTQPVFDVAAKETKYTPGVVYVCPAGLAAVDVLPFPKFQL